MTALTRYDNQKATIATKPTIIAIKATIIVIKVKILGTKNKCECERPPPIWRHD